MAADNKSTPKSPNLLSSLSSSPYHEIVERLNNMGNMKYRRASFLDAISFYDKTIALCPQNAACHNNKAASLIGLGRLTESMEECLQAIKCYTLCSRARHRLGILYTRYLVCNCNPVSSSSSICRCCKHFFYCIPNFRQPHCLC